VDQNTLFAGGEIFTAGGKVSAYLAGWVIGPPTILPQPQSTNVMAGSRARFAAGAGGFPPAYQWFKNGQGLANVGNVSGANTNALTLANVFVNDPGGYQMIVTNAYGSATSSVATLTVSNLPLTLLGGNLSSASQPFSLTLAGPVGANTVIYASTNLATWFPLATNPLPLGSLIFTDALATNFSRRSYHVTMARP
jgi:hypothetical protein